LDADDQTQLSRDHEISKLTRTIIGCAYRVHGTLGPGFLEKVYENALAIELAEAGLAVCQQSPVRVRYHGRVVGDYIADILVNECVLVEVKAVQALSREHETQVVHYLTATGIAHGLLINFGTSVQVKHKYRDLPRGPAPAEVSGNTTFSVKPEASGPG